jgi:formate hydrogenlyase transcriptional activator
VETGVAWDTHLQLLHPDDHEPSRKVGETILSTGSAGQAAFRVRNADGVYRWFLSRVEPFRASDGTVLCFIGINLDMEERKRPRKRFGNRKQNSVRCWSSRLNW